MTPEQRDFGSKLFAALANPARLHILEFLSEGPATVNEIAEAVGLKQSMTSQHLASMLTAGAVVYQKSGNTRLYSLRGPRLARVVQLVEEFYEAHLESIRELIARENQDAV